MRKHASEITYDECSFLGIPALLTDWRISRSTVPDGVHAYELRHADGNPFDPLPSCQRHPRELLRQHPDLAAPSNPGGRLSGF